MNTLTDAIDFDSYFSDQVDESAKVRPAAEWADAVIDRFFGEGRQSNWTPTGFAKTDGKFDVRPGEVTIWAGINGHGKTTYLSNIMLNLMQAGQKVCLMSLEMKPADSMAKMVRQAAGSGAPSMAFIRAFHQWTNEKLWIYDHVGRVAPARALAVATYVRKELGLDHIVIDSLMKVSAGMSSDDYSAQRDFVDGLCVIARDTGLSIHLVCHMRKGENERTAPGKFDVKGAGEITDLVDNLMIVCKNLRKAPKADEEANNTDPDAFVLVAKQRHHPWEGSFAFWFDKESQQFCETQWAKPRYIDLEIL
ncbi:MAG: AAA family ATPase [Rhodoferax sp.]|uniref:DnaB-like helicase C-terminal domain-containing protein n=1 Tax=Rhodoferax sp. TaxID=50421 RepID=UPI001B412A78|nr:DnaB-like helicase C-terminal domain-containing protein [Rhodoferax sp.]MBP9149237.1 AAA family ATPase [Rhodoferax sp.]MBP9736188.1 AAA family ATPase [Rhodoferax sp.]